MDFEWKETLSSSDWGLGRAGGREGLEGQLCLLSCLWEGLGQTRRCISSTSKEWEGEISMQSGFL